MFSLDSIPIQRTTQLGRNSCREEIDSKDGGVSIHNTGCSGARRPCGETLISPDAGDVSPPSGQGVRQTRVEDRHPFPTCSVSHWKPIRYDGCAFQFADRGRVIP